MGKRKTSRRADAARREEDETATLSCRIRPQTEIYVCLTLAWLFGSTFLLSPLLQSILSRYYALTMLYGLMVAMGPALLIRTIWTACHEEPVTVATDRMKFKKYLYLSLLWMPFCLLGLPRLLERLTDNRILLFDICFVLAMIEPVWLIYIMLKGGERSLPTAEPIKLKK